eukprot:2226693-Prymnesium_polylepis.1
MVVAHECAFEAFHAGASTHLLTIPDATAPRAPHSEAGASPQGPPSYSSRVSMRWCIGIFNFQLVKREKCKFTLSASIVGGGGGGQP